MDDTGHLDSSDHSGWKYTFPDDLKSVEEIRAFMRNAPWMPFEDYKAHIYEWCNSREIAQLNIETDFFGAQSKANQLLREAAWMMAMEQRPTFGVGNDWTLDEQHKLEEELYNKFMFAAFEKAVPSSPWPTEEG